MIDFIPNFMAKLLHYLLFIVILWVNLLFVYSQNCDKSFNDYEREGYKVSQIRFNTPLKGILGTFKKNPKEYLVSPDIPQQIGLPFKESLADQVGLELKKKINNDSPIKSVPVRVQISAYSLENCNIQKKELEIVYKFYIFQPAYYFTRTFELSKDEEVKGNSPPKQKDFFIKRIEVQPFVGYDNSKLFHGGSRFKVEFANPVIKHFAFEISGSTKSREIKAEINGEKTSNTSLLRFQKWQANYQNTDIPANLNKLAKITGATQYYASTRGFSKNELIFRFGGGLEYSKLESKLSVNQLNPQILQKGDVISGKGFIGVSFKAKDHRFKISYGFQASSINNSNKIDYLKNIIDSGAEFKFGSFNSKINLNAGQLKIMGRILVADRFFGGNESNNFLKSDDWHINSNPLLQSLGVNQLTSAESTNQLGGDSFVALNAEISFRLWRKPLIDKKIWENPNQPGELRDEIKAAENTGFNAGEELLKNDYLKNMPEFRRFPDLITQLETTINETRNSINKIDNSFQTPLIQNTMNELLNSNSLKRLQISENTIAEIKQDYPQNKSISEKIEALVVEPGVEDEKSLIQDIIDRLDIFSRELRRGNNNNLANEFQKNSVNLTKFKNEMLNIFNIIQNSPQATSALEKAKRDLEYPRQIFQYFIKESDWISLHPVIIYDAVKLKQNFSSSNPWRFGVGGGLKVRLIFLDLTTGYVWNLQNKIGEPRGSVLFRFNVADIFK